MSRQGLFYQKRKLQKEFEFFCREKGFELENLKSKGKNRAYTINNQSYSYEELYKFVCNIYHFILLNNKEK